MHLFMFKRSFKLLFILTWTGSFLWFYAQNWPRGVAWWYHLYTTAIPSAIIAALLSLLITAVHSVIRRFSQ